MLSAERIRNRMRKIITVAARREGMDLNGWCNAHNVSVTAFAAPQNIYKGKVTYPSLRTLYALEEATGYPAWKLLYTQGDENGKQE